MNLSDDIVILDIAGSIGALAGFLFTGAAVYVSLVEHPARLTTPTDVATTSWRPSYRRAAAVQSGLVVVSVIGSVASSLVGGGRSCCSRRR